MSKHMKRLAQPRRWKLPKKANKWALKPNAGPHATSDTLPLGIALRDELKVAGRAREARRILQQGAVLVDGRVVREPRWGVGFMDVVSLPDMGKHFRVLYDTHGRITLTEIPADQAGFKLVRIEDKRLVKKGRTQLNLHDGRNIVVKEGEYKTGDVLKLKLPDQDIAERFAFGEGVPAYVTGGTHIGEVATIAGVHVVAASSDNIVKLKATRGGEEGEPFETILPYVFVVGKDEAVITLPEVNPRG